jgi:hypothetical protein
MGLSSHFLHAQDESDALRFSYPLPGGTARSSALAGAFGALGGDLSAAATNPAGIGLYRTSEVSISPSLEFNSTETDHYGTSNTAANERFFLNNAGFVINYGPKEGTKWQSSSFGLTFDRTRSLNFEYEAASATVPVSIADQFVSEANGTSTSSIENAFPFSASLGWEAYVFDPDTSFADMYTSNFPEGGSVQQSHRIRTRGATGVTNLFFAANYNHRLFVGASIGIATARFERSITHRDQTNDDLNALQTVTYKEDLTTTGSGLDFKIGAIYRIGENLRLGGAVHTPTGWSMNDAWVTEVSSNFRSGTSPTNSNPITALSEEGVFAYRISTPWRFIASAAYIFGKKGLVSFEYEHLNLASSKLRAAANGLDGYDFELENSRIQNRFTTSHQVRAGAEWRLGLIYFRAGGGIWPDAFTDNDVQSGDDLVMYSGGIGYRKSQLSLDLGIQSYSRSDNFFSLSPSIIDMSTATGRSTRAIITLSYRP